MTQHKYIFLIAVVCGFLATCSSRPADEQSLQTSVSFLPFYGGAKGHYLEVTLGDDGTVIKERVVSEKEISSENIVKNRDENLISKVLAANLQSMKAQSGSLLKLHIKARNVGQLIQNEKIQFRNQLMTLSETASNLIKLVEEIGDDVDMLFKSNVTTKQYQEDDIEEEGVGIDMPESDNSDLSDLTILGDVLSGATIAEAKPVGLAVVGENGVAAARPVGTAVAAHGVALASPQATAIAGVDPAALGISFNINHFKP